MTALGAGLTAGLVPWLLGVAVLRAVRGRSSSGCCLAFPAHAWIVGSLAWAALILVAVVFGAGALVPASTTFGLGVVLVAAVRWARSSHEAGADRAEERARRGGAPGLEDLAAALILALLLGVTADRMVRASDVPVTDRDEAFLWGIKAKVLFSATQSAVPFRDLLDRQPVAHADYPPLNPLLQVGAHLLAGEILHVWHRLPAQTATLALVLVLAAELRRAVRPLLAAALLTSVVATPMFRESVAFASADHMVALGLLVAVAGWLRLRDDADGIAPEALLAGGALLAVAAKNEGTMLLTLLSPFALVSTAPDRRVRVLGALALPWAVVAGLRISNAVLGLHNDLTTGLFERLVSEAPGRVPRVAGALASELATNPAFAPVVGVGIVALLASRRIPGDPARAVAGLLLAALTVHGVIYASTPHDLEWHLATSLRRVLFQLLPTAALGTALAVARAAPTLGSRRRLP